MDPFRDLLDKEFRSMLTGEFAEDTHVRASFSLVARIRGIFDSTYLEVDPSSGATVASRKPRVTVFQNDVPFVILQGAIVSARGAAYRVRDIQPDGFGGATLYLDPARASDTNASDLQADDAPFPEDMQGAAVQADGFEDQQWIEAMYDGSLPFAGGFQYDEGLTLPAFDKPIHLTVTTRGVPEQEVVA